MDSGLYNKALNISLKYDLPEEMAQEARDKSEARK
jgi:hypothetical protein